METVKNIVRTLPVPPRMYRHFAVVTVVLTLIIALFADGENREAIGNEISAQKQQTAMRNAEAEQLGPRKVAKRDLQPRQSAGWGEDGPVEPAGSGIGASEVAVRRENGDVERVNGQDFGIIGPGATLQRAGGTISRVGAIPPRARRKPTPEERAKLEQAGFDAAGGNRGLPRS